MKDSDIILFTKDEFDRVLDSLPRCPLELVVIAHTMLVEGKLSKKDDQIYSVILKASKNLLEMLPKEMKIAFPEMFQ